MYNIHPNSHTRGHLISACYWSIDIYAALHYITSYKTSISKGAPPQISHTL